MRQKIPKKECERKLQRSADLELPQLNREMLEDPPIERGNSRVIRLDAGLWGPSKIAWILLIMDALVPVLTVPVLQADKILSPEIV